MARQRTKYGRLYRNANPRPVGRQFGCPFSAEQIEEMLFMIDAGLRWREVMEHFNVTAPTINYWLKKRQSAAQQRQSEEK